MTVAELQAALAPIPPDQEILVVFDRFDTGLLAVEAGTDGDNEPICWLITAHAEGEPARLMDDRPTVTCCLCSRDVPKATAHWHQDQWIGDDCCWDERLRSSE